MAGIPNPANCSFGSWIDVVATNGTSADAYGTYSVTVHDISDLPIAGSTVTLNFAVASEIRLCTDFEPAGQVNTCNIATKLTNASGVATFIVCGAANDPGGLTAGPGAGGVEVRADSYLLGTISAACFDLNGRLSGGAGVSSADASIFSTDNGLFGGVGNPAYKARCDFSHDGAITSTDASYASTLRGYGTSAVGCTYCP
jgi:hypothetical protein